MGNLLVLERPEDWPLSTPGATLVLAREYLTDPRFSTSRHRVFNLCRSYRYQSLGYYVSLLAEARGHRPLPGVATIQDLKSQSLVRFMAEDLDDLLQRSLASLGSTTFTLSIYFGRNLAKRYQRLSLQLFNLFPAPLLRAELERRDDEWSLRRLRLMPFKEIPEEHRDFAIQAAGEYFSRGRTSVPKRPPSRYDLAILVNPEDRQPPSDEKALARFVKAGQSLGLGVDLIERDDYGRVGEYDGLFLRDTTQVNHYTYRFARRAAADGLVVIDDPQSIVRCANKVYLAEILTRARIPTPRTALLHRDIVRSAQQALGLPCILKLPDSSFSQGVVRVETPEALRRQAAIFLEESDLVVAQEFLPSDFDWRVGVLNRQPLYVCKYFMARHHWQIVRRDSRGRSHYGKVETLAVEAAPARVVETAVHAANLIGDGLYGVDLKERDGRAYVIEINDNPNLDAGYEDAVLGDELYLRIMRLFLERMEKRTERKER